ACLPPPPLRLPGRAQVAVPRQGHGHAPGPRRREGRQGHAPEQQARQCRRLQAEGVRGSRAPARRPAARALRDQAGGPVTDENITPEAEVADDTVADLAAEVAEDYSEADYAGGTEYVADAEEQLAPVISSGPTQAVGRRKEAVARVRLV